MAVIDAPQALLVSNNPYRMDDPAGLGYRERLESGLLGVLGIKVENAAEAAGLLLGVHSTGLTVLTAREVVVDADLPEVEVGVDGEAFVLPTPVRCRIEPGALRVRVPATGRACRRPSRPWTGAGCANSRRRWAVRHSPSTVPCPGTSRCPRTGPHPPHDPPHELSHDPPHDIDKLRPRTVLMGHER